MQWLFYGNKVVCFVKAEIANSNNLSATFRLLKWLEHQQRNLSQKKMQTFDIQQRPLWIQTKAIGDNTGIVSWI